eukprot:Nitzschia sp. Nitz4//scaffold29_size155292//121564//122591//NITZ4_002682-RA/size155292-augustus-gene-0.213-mRNA-1//1//CDS//3329546520//1276//frame0
MTVTKKTTGEAKERKSPSPSVQMKHQQLNRFLSKTFHMVNNGDPTIVAWAPNGDSFLVKDIEAFSEVSTMRYLEGGSSVVTHDSILILQKVLPLYFKHSKFSSFVRQLNFYGFRKIRPDASVLNEDEDLVSNAVRFYHEYFQEDRPDLLHKINRATKTPELNPPGQVESMQAEIDSLKERLEKVSDDMEEKLAKMKKSLEMEYRGRISSLESALQEVVTSLVSDRLAAPSTAALAATLQQVRSPLTAQLSPLYGLANASSLLGRESLLNKAGSDPFSSVLR